VYNKEESRKNPKKKGKDIVVGILPIMWLPLSKKMAAM
jgi:hypothetical protein